MSQQNKKILFIFFSILFFITSFLVVFYSLGWRFDWEKREITQPGIFYFKVFPKNAKIYIDNKFKKKTDFFFGSALIEDLLPKKYDVKIEKQGFYSWEKNLEIKERQVTDAKNIILIPKNIKFSNISNNIENIYSSPDGKKIILEEIIKDNKQKKTIQKKWSLKLFEPDKNLKSQLINENDILSAIQKKLGNKKVKNAQLVDLKISSNSKTILLEISFQENLKYYLLEINEIPPALIPLNFSDIIRKKQSIINKIIQNIEEIYFDPKSPSKFFILSSIISEDKPGEETKILSKIDIKNKKIIPVLSDIVACSIYNNAIYYLNKSGFIFKTDFSFQNKEKLNIIPLNKIKKETAYKIAVSKSHLILKEGGNLYLLKKNKILEKISNSVKSFKFSPDSKKLVYFNDHEIWILYLEKEYDQPTRDKNEKVFLTRFSEKIGKLFWWTNNYLIFNTGNKIRISEIDNRDNINITEIANFENPQILWNYKNNKLYVLSKNILYISRSLLY